MTVVALAASSAINLAYLYVLISASLGGEGSALGTFHNLSLSLFAARFAFDGLVSGALALGLLVSHNSQRTWRKTAVALILVTLLWTGALIIVGYTVLILQILLLTYILVRLRSELRLG